MFFYANMITDKNANCDKNVLNYSRKDRNAIRKKCEKPNS